MQTIIKKTKKEQAIQWNRRLRDNEYTQRRLTFGKYTNTQIKDIPLDYLQWGIQNLNSIWASEFARELQRREPKYRK